MELNNTILITGSTGQVGSALVRRLRSAGYRNLLTPTYVEMDLSSLQHVSHYFLTHRPEYIFHMAEYRGDYEAHERLPAEFIFQNTQIHSNVIHVAHRFGVKKLLFPGSVAAYPINADQPIREAAFLSGAIGTVNLPSVIAKMNSIVMAQSYRKQYGLNVIIPMLTTAYGMEDFSRKNKTFVSNLMQRFCNAKAQGAVEVVVPGAEGLLHELIYVDDLADILFYLMRTYKDESIINVGTMEEVSTLVLCKMIAKIVGYEGRIYYDKSIDYTSPRRCLDCRRIFEFGWRPKVSLQLGLQKLFEQHFLKETV